jgi:3-oxoadipate enol-lactonase
MPYTENDGANIWYEVSGEGDPLLLIMGLGADSTGWILQRKPFAERYQVIVFDNRGVGRSSCPPPPFSTEQMAGDALAVLDAVGIERAHVLGVSLGGAIAQHVALRAPERVRSLILAATWAGPSVWRSRVRDVQLAVARTAGREALITLRMLFVFSPLLFNDNPQLADLIQKTLLESPATLEGYLAQVDAAEFHDARARLGELTMPTLAITGRRDVLVPPELTEEIASSIAGAELVKLESAHAIQFEEVAAFNDAVLSFLEKH